MRPRLPRPALGLGAIILLALSVQPAMPHDGHSPAIAVDPAVCTCDQAVSVNGWCVACETGYVAGFAVPTPVLYELLDPHGHEVDHSRITCGTCPRARAVDGYCHECGIGFVGGSAYVSRLAYLGRLRDTGALDKDGEVELAREGTRLRESLRHLDRCELCVAASFTGGRCPNCDIHYPRREEAESTERGDGS